MATITSNPLQEKETESMWDKGLLDTLKEDPPKGTFPWYSADETYVPQVQADGGQLSEWKPKYSASPEQAERDRLAAYEAGVPHGYQPPRDQYAGLPTVSLLVVSELHEDGEYGERVDAAGHHSGGPFRVDIALKMRVQDLRRVIMA